ncbi:MAG TPA: tape measure protein [Candidatus Competibacteraceae bacterium]|nr:tape measure protein [Candidatus Competibacteraceae bacterium]
MADQKLQIELSAEDKASAELRKLAEALKQLGVDVEGITDGLTTSEAKVVNSFSSIAKSSQAAGDTIEKALVAALDQIKTPAGIDRLQNELRDLAQSGRLSSAELERLGDWQRDLSQRAQAAATAQRKLADGTDEVSKGARAAAALVQQLEQSMADLAAQRNPTDEFNRGLQEVEQSGRKAGASIQATTEPLGGLKSALAAVGVVELARQILDLNDQMTALKRGFDVITGSSQATTNALDFVRGVADRLGVSSTDLAQSFLKITAAAKGTQLEGAASEKIFSALAGAMSTVGASAADVDSAMNAVAQMMSKGVISAEELRGQLGDVLPGAAQQAASALLATNAEFSKMLESGQVMASEFLPKFAEQLEKSMGGGQGQVESFGASWNRLKNQLADLATGPLGKGLTDFLAVLADGLGITVRAASATSDAIGAVGRAIGGLAAGEVGTALDDLGQSLNNAAAKLFGYKTSAQEAAEREKQIAAEAKAAIPEIDRLQSAVDGKELKELPETLQAAIAEFRKTGDAAKAAEGAISAFMAEPAKNLDLTGVLKLATSLKAVGTEAGAAGQKIPETLGAALSKLTNEQLTQLEQQARKAIAEVGNNDNAKKAFADLGLIIEGVVLARLQRLGVDGPEALNGISTAATDAIQDFTALATNADLSADTIEKAFEGALQKLDNPKEIETFRQKIVELGENGTLSGEQVERALLLIGQRLQEVSSDPAFAALKEILSGIREEAERDIAVAERQAEINSARIQAAIALARARGDEAEAARLVAQATQEEIDRTQEHINQLGKQQSLIDAHIQKLYAQANADGLYDKAERAVIEALKEKSATLGKEIALLDQRLPKLEREAQQAQVMAGPIGQLTRLYAEQTQEHERAAAASDRYYDTQLKEIDGALKVAQAHGDEAEAARLVAQQQDVLINQAQAQAAAAQQAASDAQKTVDAYTLQATATEGLSQAEQEQIAKLKDVANAKANAAQQATDYAETLKDETAATRAKVEADREAAKATKAAAEANAQRQAAGEAVTSVMNKEIAAIRALGGDTEALTERFHELQRQFSNDAMLDMNDWMGRLAGATRQVKQEFEAQKETAEALIAQYEGIADGTQDATAAQLRMGEVVGDTGREFGLLNEQDLSRLQSAIEAANQKLREMQQETQDARNELQELNAELLEAQGQDQKAELLRQELDYQERLAAIELRRREAELLGNRDLVALLDRQADVLRQINDAKVKSIQADANAEQAGDKVARSWVNAEAAVRATKSTLGEVHSLSTKIAQTDLSGFEKGMTGVADAATKLSRIL